MFKVIGFLTASTILVGQPCLAATVTREVSAISATQSPINSDALNHLEPEKKTSYLIHALGKNNGSEWIASEFLTLLEQCLNYPYISKILFGKAFKEGAPEEQKRTVQLIEACFKELILYVKTPQLQKMFSVKQLDSATLDLPSFKVGTPIEGMSSKNIQAIPVTLSKKAVINFFSGQERTLIFFWHRNTEGVWKLFDLKWGSWSLLEALPQTAFVTNSEHDSLKTTNEQLEAMLQFARAMKV